MSAICGIVHRHRQPVTAEMLSQLMTSLEAYGPDDSGQWYEGNAALGHQMLHLTPESLHAVVPWRDAESEQIITADARLDNRSELYASLEISPQVGRGLSDAQLILKSYRKWGESCPSYLLGDFAFAIWDVRQQQLFCARDIIGVRPFYYHTSPSRFLFASDINSLLKTPGIEKRLYEPLLVAMLQGHTLKYAEKNATFYDGIVKLPPAHSLLVTPTRVETSCYWSPETVSEIDLESESEYIEVLQGLLGESVQCRLRSAFPVGTHLSGGLDSSAVAVLVERQLRAQGHSSMAFSWAPVPGMAHKPGDEYHLIQEICRQEQIACNYIDQTAQDIINIRVRDFTTQPNTMLMREQHVQSVAKQHNIRLLLSGWGGDEGITFNGRGYFAELFLQGHWRTLWRESNLRRDLHGGTVRQWLRTRVLEALLPDLFYDALHVWRKTPRYSPTDQSAYIQHEFVRRHQAAMQPLLRRTLRERPGARQYQRELLTHGHLTKRIEDWAISGGQQGLVYSYPLLDRRILEFALGVPVDLFFKHGWKRYLFRKATAGILPDTIRWNKTKDEPALWANQRELGNELKAMGKQCFDDAIATGLKVPQLAEYVDVKRLEMAYKDPSLQQTGFAPALQLAWLLGIQALKEHQ